MWGDELQKGGEETVDWNVKTKQKVKATKRNTPPPKNRGVKKAHKSQKIWRRTVKLLRPQPCPASTGPAHPRLSPVNRTIPHPDELLSSIGSEDDAVVVVCVPFVYTRTPWIVQNLVI